VEQQTDLHRPEDQGQQGHEDQEELDLRLARVPYFPTPDTSQWNGPRSTYAPTRTTVPRTAVGTMYDGPISPRSAPANSASRPAGWTPPHTAAPCCLLPISTSLTINLPAARRARGGSPGRSTEPHSRAP